MGVPLSSEHPDYHVLRPLVDLFLQSAGGEARIAQEIPQILRRALDEVIDTHRTSRFTISEIEKTEKTYIGTKVEILLRAFLKLPKGRILDLSIGGVETDIKNTIGSNWTIPMEAIEHPCLLVKESEKRATCSVGLIIAREEYLNPGKNRDAKRSFSAKGLQNVWWLLKDHPYPPNFWEQLPLQTRQQIMVAGGGTARLAALFSSVQDRPISRLIVQAVAQQDDYMKRVRRNGGARDVLAPQGIAILWGQADRTLIKRLNLGPVSRDEFISHKPRDKVEEMLLRDAKHID